MTVYNVQNTQNVVVAQIGPSTTTATLFPLELVGQGISPYGEIMAQNLYRQLENFSSPLAPTNPVIGMNWYKFDTKVPHYYDGTQFIPYGTGLNSASVGFALLPASTNLDLTVAGPTVIFQAPGTAARYHPTGLLLVPVGSVTASSPASVNLSVDVSEDILENIVVDGLSANRHGYYGIAGATRFATGVETIKFNVSGAATGGNLTVRAYLFGLVT